jgi:diguanylate cyclase (GGDEF)-like protein
MTSIGTKEHGERRAYWIETGHAVHLEGRLPADQYTDRSTGCRNRHYLLETLEPQIAVAQQYGFPLSLALAEIAHFRQIRFTFGESAADGILSELSEIVSSTVRGTDLVVRYADETFAVLFLHSTQFGASRACDRMRMKISHHTFHSVKSDLVVVVNFGIAEQSADFDPHGRTLLSAAEGALRHAGAVGDYAIVRHADLQTVPERAL